MDITSPRLLKFKGLLFLVLGLISGFLLLAPVFTWTNLVLLGLCLWSFCRAYYFCFYVMQHYVDKNFRYAGLWHLFRHLVRNKPEAGHPEAEPPDQGMS